jgi:hypothetical protein
MLWLPLFLLWAPTSGIDFRTQLGPSLLASPAMGGVLWYFEALLPRGWLYTWIPTLGTALLYRDLVSRIPRTRFSWSRARMGSSALHLAVAATISALVFCTCIAVGALLGLHPPFLPAALTAHDSTGAAVVSLTVGTFIGMASIIGGILGAVLGALRPGVETVASDAIQPAVPGPLAFSPSTSLRLVVGTFLVVGPQLYMPLISVFSYLSGLETASVGRQFGHVVSLPLLAPIGAIMWYGALLYPPAWLQTWIPTLGTAFLFWVAITRFPIRRWTSGGPGELGAVLAYTMICASLSVIVFTLCQTLVGLFTHDAAVGPSHGEFSDLLSSAAGLSMLMVVAILGAILGGAVYFIELRMSRHR